MSKIQRLKEIIETSNSIVLFTGAGISVPSGIPDFRSNDGIYSKQYEDKLSPEIIISRTFFYNNPKIFYQYYKKHLVFPDVLPNKAHNYFTNLEKAGKLKAIITQNIDNFHQASGSKNVYELHGSVHRNYCKKCNKFFDLNYILKSEDIPYCDECGGIVKPDVVLYEESLDYEILQKSISAIKSCDTMIIVGTSLVVYPAAGLVSFFKGENLILINKQKTHYDREANLVFNENIIKVIEELEKIS